MKQNGPINRIKYVLSLIGKPFFWLFLSPLLLFFFVRNVIRAILHVTATHLLRIHSVPKKHRRGKRRATHVIFDRRRRSYRRIKNFFTSLRTTAQKALSRMRAFRIRVSAPLPNVSLPRHTLFFSAVFIFLSLGALTAYSFYRVVLKDLPTPSDLLTHKPIMTTKIYDRNHVLLYKIYKDENRSIISLDQISPYLREATIAIEDKDFYTHRGFSLRGIIRSVKLLLTQKKIQGGSTITQQLVKNVLLSRERTLIRKIKELILATQVETALGKDQILQMYLNNVSYGGSVYGIEEAAQRYFHIPARDLDLAQSAFLAGLPAAPSIYSPAGPRPELAFERQHEVLRRLVEDGKISHEEAQAAQQEKLNFSITGSDIKAPHFVMYIRDMLARQYGEELLTQGGLEVTTSLDAQLQTRVETTVATEVKQLAPLRVSNGAALVTNPQTGEVLAMVGSKDYFDAAHDGQVNVTLRPRQPGSSIKPLMYAAALERGFTPATILDDSPVVYQSAGSPPYAPKNYDGQFHGKEPLRFALASSHNVPAVKTENTIGLSTFIHKAQALGITTWDTPDRYGLSLTLGAGEVLMTDMATAYGVFANSGTRVDVNPILEVKTYTGETLYHNACALDHQCEGVGVLDPRIAFQITSILSDNNARSRAFGLNSVLNIPGQQVAVKTGTTNSLRDNWTIGYTDNRLVATWVGNNDNTPMSHVTSGITGASPIWNKIMRTQLSADHPHVFPVPANLQAATLCTATGRPVCGACAITYTEYFLPGTVPAPDCSSGSVAGVESPAPTEPRKRQENKQADIRGKILDGVTTQTWDTVLLNQ